MGAFRHFPLNFQTNPDIGHDNSYEWRMMKVWQVWPCPNLGINPEDSTLTHIPCTFLEASPHLELLFRPPGSFQPQVTSVFVVAFVEIPGLEISVVGQTHERRSLFCTCWIPTGFPQSGQSPGYSWGLGMSENIWNIFGWGCMNNGWGYIDTQMAI